MKLVRQCRTCEFNVDSICTGHGDIYKYGDKITDETQICDDWGANLDYFTYTTANAPRFLREPLNDCQISYGKFSSLLDSYIGEKGIPINIFDAVKFIYGISMVDIAVLLDVSFGVVYRAKTRGITAKRIKQFAELFGISPELLVSTTTRDFDKLRQAKEAFFARPDIEQRLNAMPEWKQTLAHNISSLYLHCPIHIAREFARVDKIYWTDQMPMEGLTESEEKMIIFITHSSKYYRPVISLDYSLDIACIPHMKIAMYNS